MKAPIEGQIESYSVKTWPTIGSIFKNGFVKGFKTGIDGDIDYQGVLLNEELNEELDSLGFFQFKKKKALKDKIKENEKDLEEAGLK